ncbi:aminoglycoside phosphotransferase family protein [Nostoc sp.]|uniref:aminoglycoside phosphotransferase family protein n=1 Tax=Nostoc sp. TaxID=1180 RepID=UPI003593BA17
MKGKLNHQNLFKYLVDANICQEKDLEYLQVDVKCSKNYYWILNLPIYNIAVKQISHKYEPIIDNSISNELYIHDFLPSCPDLFYTSSLAPNILHFDGINSILIYKYSSDYVNLESYYENNNSFPISIAKLVGHTLATLHSETRNSQNCYKSLTKYKDNFKDTFPYNNYILNRIEPENLRRFPVEGLRFIAFYQRYEKLKNAVIELVAHQSHCCLTHNNLHLNKILIHRQSEKLLSKTDYYDLSLIKLLDWESFSWGEPACDLGIAIAGYLLVWLNSITVHPAIELEQSLQLATIPLEMIYPSIAAMTKAYINTYPKVLEDHADFLKRVIQFAGLGLIYTILRNFQDPNLSNNRFICMMEVGKNLLCQPEESFSSVFGLTVSDIIDTALHSSK